MLGLQRYREVGGCLGQVSWQGTKVTVSVALLACVALGCVGLWSMPWVGGVVEGQ
jgi:hypothetical protein